MEAYKQNMKTRIIAAVVLLTGCGAQQTDMAVNEFPDEMYGEEYIIEDAVVEQVVPLSAVPEDAAVSETAKEETEVPVEYYKLNGVKVENPGKGIYIKRQGTRTSKVVLQ